MKLNTAFASTVLLACVSLTVGVDVGPFTPWRSVINTNLCVVPSSTANGASLVVKACDGTLLQLRSRLKDGTNVYRLQNGGTPNACAWIDDGGPFNGQTVRIGECSLSDGAGKTVSNAQWDSGTGLPNVVQLKSRIHFGTTNGCIDLANSNAVIEGCNSAILTQKWIMGD